MRRTAFAPAKINLFLHVGAPAPDGFHPIASLMAFADVGDRVTLDTEGSGAFAVEGPFAGELGTTAPADNLVLRAARALEAQAGVAAPPFDLTLTKALPIASGLGGGSSDAGATLRVLRDTLLPVPDTVLEAAAAATGSDGPPCLWGRPVISEGRGERLSASPAFPPLPAVLVNPRVACPTGAVYRAFDAFAEPGRAADRPLLPNAFVTVAQTAAFMAACRNDLENPAIGLVPVIGRVLDRLRAEPGVLMARLSGSGATCFAILGTDGEAKAFAGALATEHPGWWIEPCRIGGPWPD